MFIVTVAEYVGGSGEVGGVGSGGGVGGGEGGGGLDEPLAMESIMARWMSIAQGAAI
jgi:hypothetical protein